ncbi:hypothetical protein NPIL_632911 [Nephila pilipes]|uniref:Uncharacterized protein n=1 Tax=Nephila pilipes TaxID=299642 RepID=A0A8X6Q2L8_NEPPI|nr:hypothetical protein NPIL_632911 [Nephila pilipes]
MFSTKTPKIAWRILSHSSLKTSLSSCTLRCGDETSTKSIEACSLKFCKYASHYMRSISSLFSVSESSYVLYGLALLVMNRRSGTISSSLKKDERDPRIHLCSTAVT